MGNMNDDLKWQETKQNFRTTRPNKLLTGEVRFEAAMVEQRVWEAKLDPFTLSIVEGDLYFAARVSHLMHIGQYVYGPDMESAKEALLTYMVDAFESYVSMLQRELNQ